MNTSKNLLILDTPSEEDRYRSFLAELPAAKRFCSDGQEAFQAISDPSVCVAVLLWELSTSPRTPEILLRLRRERPDLPVIVVSGVLDLTLFAQAKELGAIDFLLKPLEKKRLSEAVQRVLLPRQSEPELLEKLRNKIRGESSALLNTLENLARIIRKTKEAVLIVGETGTGKELLAYSIHEFTPRETQRKNAPWTPVNVASIPSNLMESALFGHEKGAFTGADQQHVGAFEECAGGTLFLDEIGELDLPLQAKLLRVLQERTFRRVGGQEDLSFSARLVCATHRDLIVEVREKRFREDLYHRIAAHEVRSPPLREREEDLWVLADFFLEQHGGERIVRLAKETKAILSAYTFPGNVRELQNLMKHCLVECPDEQILPYHLPVEIMRERQGEAHPENVLAWPAEFLDLPHKDAIHQIEQLFNREYLPLRVSESQGNRTQAAKAAGLDPKTFRAKWKEAGLEKTP